MSAHETAEAILIVIKRVAKWIALFILGVGLFFAVIAAYDSADNYFSYEMPKKKVSLKAIFDKEMCSSEYPLAVMVNNNSNKKLLKVNFEVVVTKKGYSSKLNEYTSYEYDRILNKNEGFPLCYAVFSKDYDKSYEKIRLDGEDMYVKVTDYTVTFE
jgi:hypothetical protein